MLKHNNRAIELLDILDSDDELPTNYNEKPDLPAYLDDKRFDPIQFSWIKSNKVRSIPVKPLLTPVPAQHPRQEILPVANQECSNKNLIKMGILNEEDILCMRSVASQTTDDAALLWFIDFLMHKDLQADYRFLKSCLVVSLDKYINARTQYSQIFNSKSLKNCFQLFVK